MNEVSEQARALLAAEFAEPYADLIRTDHYEGPETIPVSAALRAIEKALALSASSDATGWEEARRSLTAAESDLHEGLTAALPSDERGWMLRYRFQAALDAVSNALANLPSPPTPPPVESETSHEQ